MHNLLSYAAVFVASKKPVSSKTSRFVVRHYDFVNGLIDLKPKVDVE